MRGVRVAGRNTQGVKLINLDMGDVITAVARVVPDDTADGEGGDEGEDTTPDDQLELKSEE